MATEYIVHIVIIKSNFIELTLAHAQMNVDEWAVIKRGLAPPIKNWI